MTIYLDLDGPLLDVSRRYHRIYASIVRELGGRPLPASLYWRLKRMGNREAQIRAARHPEIDQGAYDALFLDRIESPPFLAEDRVVEGALETLASLRGPFRLVLATLRRRGGAMSDQIRAVGLSRLLDHVLQRDGNSGSWSDKAEMIRRDLRLGVGGADRSVIVGDSESDVRCAVAAGITSVAVCNGIRSREFLLRHRPDRVIETVRDLPGCLPPGGPGGPVARHRSDNGEEVAS